MGLKKLKLVFQLFQSAIDIIINLCFTLKVFKPLSKSVQLAQLIQN